jgi:protein RecA
MIYQALAMQPLLIVVDSVSAMIPKAFLEGAVDEMGRIGLQAQLMSVSLNYLTKHLPEANTCLLFTNQLRSVIKKSKYDTGPDEETSGGRALKYYSSVRIKMKKGLVKTTIIKNKIDKPWYTAPLFIRFGEGFDNIASIIELAINTNTIKKSGAFLSLKDEDKTIFNVQGKEQLNTLLQEDNNILKLLSSKIVLQQDTEAKKQAEQEENEELNDDGVDLDLILNQTSETFKKKTEEKTAESEEENVEPIENKRKKSSKRKENI